MAQATGVAKILASGLDRETGWWQQLGDQFSAPYMLQLQAFLEHEDRAGKVIYPSLANCFNALNCTAFEDVSVVILGQDPYHGDGQAHGLSFSVLPDVRVPPSLRNIYKELHADIGFQIPGHGYLQSWAEQGVLLLNSVLTVEAGKPASHQGKGWEMFTDRVIQRVNSERSGVVFLLWGSYAQKKAAFVDTSKHLVLKSVHPSPLSANRGFLGCRHFSATNRYLAQNGKSKIDWTLPESVSAQQSLITA